MEITTILRSNHDKIGLDFKERLHVLFRSFPLMRHDSKIFRILRHEMNLVDALKGSANQIYLLMFYMFFAMTYIVILFQKTTPYEVKKYDDDHKG